MFGLLEKVGKTIWEVSNLPVDIARDIVTQDDDSWTEGQQPWPEGRRLVIIKSYSKFCCNHNRVC